MKKILSILGLVTAIGIGSFAYASDGVVENTRNKDYPSNSNYEDRIEERHHNRREYHRDELKRSLEEGEISQEEAKKWEEHYKYMDEFHKENGYRGCHGEGHNRSHHGRRGMGRRARY